MSFGVTSALWRSRLVYSASLFKLQQFGQFGRLLIKRDYRFHRSKATGYLSGFVVLNKGSGWRTLKSDVYINFMYSFADALFYCLFY